MRAEDTVPCGDMWYILQQEAITDAACLHKHVMSMEVCIPTAARQRIFTGICPS